MCWGGRGPPCPEVELDPGFGRTVEARDAGTLSSLFAFMLPLGAHPCTRAGPLTFLRIPAPELAGASGSKCFPSLLAWMLLFKRQRRGAAFVSRPGFGECSGV